MTTQRRFLSISGGLFFLMHVIACPLHAQQSSSAQLATDFIDRSKENFSEKIYVHNDKELYFSDEIIWFRLFVADAAYHKPMDVSKVAYVEVLDAANNPVLQGKVQLDKSCGKGSFQIPSALRSGYYKLRAYTNWMKNFSPEFYYQKKITIINPDNNYRVKDSTPDDDRMQIAFFPEGGTMINGVPARIAFRINDNNGHGLDAAGVVVDGNNDTAASFRTLKFGIGSFTFTPRANTSYKAIINHGSGEPQTKEIPAAVNNGYAMQLEEQGKNIQINIATSQAGSVYMLCHTRGVVKSAQAASVDGGRVQFAISSDSLGDGISHFTIFDEQRRPVCERLYFKRPARSLKIDARPDKQEYRKRNRINLDISTVNDSGMAAIADLSLAVVRIDSLQKASDEDIRSYMWFSSDLTGNIESPQYYLTGENDAEKKQAIDNLMLSHGWRRFNWNEFKSGKPSSFKYVPELISHVITGKITMKGSGLPAVDVNTYLSAPGPQPRFKTCKSDTLGRLKFQIENFLGTSQIVAEAVSPLNSAAYKIDIENPFSTAHSMSTLPSFEMPLRNLQTLSEENLSADVQSLYHNERMNEFRFPDHDSLSFFGKPDLHYILDNYVRFTSMEEVLREYVQNVNVIRPGGKFHLYVLEQETRLPFQTDPLVLLDGVPVFNMDKLMEYDPLKIAKIDVMARKYLYGPSEFYGIVSMQTYDGDLSGYTLDPAAVVLDYEGLQLQREFYSPDYSTAALQASKLPDYRNVLHWVPQVITDAKGKAAIGLWSSDLKGRYAVMIEGMTSNGDTGSRIVYFEVK